MSLSPEPVPRGAGPPGKRMVSQASFQVRADREKNRSRRAFCGHPGRDGEGDKAHDPEGKDPSAPPEGIAQPCACITRREQSQHTPPYLPKTRFKL